jgi:hypothetical protein
LLLTLLRLPRALGKLLSTLRGRRSDRLETFIRGSVSLTPSKIHDRNGSDLSLGGTCRTTADDIPRAFRVLSNRLIVMDWLSKDFRDNRVMLVLGFDLSSFPLVDLGDAAVINGDHRHM